MVIKQEVGKITRPDDVAKIFHAILGAENEIDQKKEHFWTIGLSTSNAIEYVELVTLGILSQTVIHPREIFRLAISKAVSKIILCHNHPGGNLEASEEDRFLTKRLIKSGIIIGIPVCDHVIIDGNGNFDSVFSWSELQTLETVFKNQLADM